MQKFKKMQNHWVEIESNINQSHAGSSEGYPDALMLAGNEIPTNVIGLLSVKSKNTVWLLPFMLVET